MQDSKDKRLTQKAASMLNSYKDTKEMQDRSKKIQKQIIFKENMILGKTRPRGKLDKGQRETITNEGRKNRWEFQKQISNNKTREVTLNI